LIIVDDGSKDRTVEIAKGFEKSDARIKVYVNEKNLGDYPNRNRAASYARGEFMTYVDSDDKLLPDTLKNILYAENIIDELNFAMYWPHSNERFKLPGHEALRKHFFERQFLYMGPGGTFIRKSFFDNIGGYPEKYGPANDMYFNLKACCNSAIHLFPFEFIYYRIHEGQEINNKQAYIYHGYNYMKDALLNLSLGFSEKEISFLLKKNKRRFAVNLIRYFLKTFNFSKSKEAWDKADFTMNDFLSGIFH
jgi:glycosyltransferase involved in cell wall biosynthesis